MRGFLFLSVFRGRFNAFAAFFIFPGLGAKYPNVSRLSCKRRGVVKLWFPISQLHHPWLSCLPQVAETNSPQQMDAAGEGLSYDDIELQVIKKEYYMSIFSDIFDKIMGKIKSLVPGANTISDVNLTAEFDKLAGKGLEWRTSVVDFLKMIGANSSRENRDALAKELGVDASFKSGSAEKNEALRKALFKKIAANGGNIPASLLD